MNRYAFFCLTIATIGLLASGQLAASAAEQPNFIFFITDDISWNDLGCYGNTFVRTPNLDRLAAEGMAFDNCYLAISSCSPSRCSIITGRYPHNTGAPELHTELPEGQYLFPLTLKEAGYYTVLSGKHHMGKAADKAFAKISKGKGPGREEDWVDILRDRPKDKPFFCWFASTDAHRGWTVNDQAPQYDPEEIQVPPYLYDGPATREDLAQYYHEVSRTDYFAGQIVEELQRQGIAENTYFIYCSDNGRPFPRCKTRLYDSGIKSPLIVWRPGRISPARCNSLVSSIDFAPTILELAGLGKDERIQGVSFAKLLDDPTGYRAGLCLRRTQLARLSSSRAHGALWQLGLHSQRLATAAELVRRIGPDLPRRARTVGSACRGFAQRPSAGHFPEAAPGGRAVRRRAGTRFN